MMVELPESAAHVATDPNRVYYVGAGGNPCRLPGLLSFHLTRPCLRLCPSLRSAHNMLDGLRQGLVRSKGRSIGGSIDGSGSKTREIRKKTGFRWRGRRDSNPRPPA